MPGWAQKFRLYRYANGQSRGDAEVGDVVYVFADCLRLSIPQCGVPGRGQSSGIGVRFEILVWSV
jgi:hypothetical protein